MRHLANRRRPAPSLLDRAWCHRCRAVYDASEGGCDACEGLTDEELDERRDRATDRHLERMEVESW